MKFLLSASIAIIALFTHNSYAQTCSPAPSCDDLGYTESVSDCYGGQYTACPFDTSYVKCIHAWSCEDLGYKHSVTSCRTGKYVRCPSDVNKVFCIETKSSCSPAEGKILFTDGSCSEYYNPEKKAVGVYVTLNGRMKLVYAYQADLAWSNEQTDTGISNYSSSQIGDDGFYKAFEDIGGAYNQEYIEDIGDMSNYPAFEYCYQMSSTVGQAGIECYLPALGELNAIRLKRTTINSYLAYIPGAHLFESEPYWSSTETNSNEAYATDVEDRSNNDPQGKRTRYTTRCLCSDEN